MPELVALTKTHLQAIAGEDRTVSIYVTQVREEVSRRADQTPLQAAEAAAEFNMLFTIELLVDEHEHGIFVPYSFDCREFRRINCAEIDTAHDRP